MKNTIHTLCKASAAPALFLLFLPCCQTARAEARTHDTLTVEELAQLSKLENQYFFGEARADAVKMISTFFVTLAIIQAVTPQTRIIRQRKRDMLNGIVLCLCALRLEQEFITHYANRLREDVLDYARDAMLQRSREFRR